MTAVVMVPLLFNSRSSRRDCARYGVTHLSVLRPVHREYVCPDLVPIRCEVAIAIDCAHRPNAVALVVFFAGLLD